MLHSCILKLGATMVLYSRASEQDVYDKERVPLSRLLTVASLLACPCLFMHMQDVYDKERIPLIKSLKQDGLTWVSKYARGGSARSQSARRMYTAVDSVVGHLAANG